MFLADVDSLAPPADVGMPGLLDVGRVDEHVGVDVGRVDPFAGEVLGQQTRRHDRLRTHRIQAHAFGSLCSGRRRRRRWRVFGGFE